MLKTTEKDMCKSNNDTQLMHLIDTWKMALADTKGTLHAVLHVYVADENNARKSGTISICQ